MSYTIVDLENSSRKLAYEQYIDSTEPMISVTAKLDVTPIYELSKKGHKFTSLLLYAILKSAEEIDESFLAIKNNQLIRYNKICIALVVKGKDNSLYYTYIPNCNSLEEFEKEYTTRTQYSQNNSCHCVLEDCALIGTSTVLGFQFESIFAGYTKQFNNPLFTWSNYKNNTNNVELNISFAVHHALMDGEQIVKLFQELKNNIDNFNKNFIFKK